MHAEPTRKPRPLHRAVALVALLAATASASTAAAQRPFRVARRVMVQDQTGAMVRPPPPPPHVVVVTPPPVAPTYVPGQVVQVEWGGQWYAARVLAIDPNGAFRIHYEGWSDSWDEAVPFTRIRISPNAQVPPPRIVVVPPNAPVYVPPTPPVVYPPMPPVVYPPAQPPVYVPPQPPVVYQPPTPRPGENLLVNGGFEASPLPPGGWQVFPSIPGWINTFGNGFEVQANAAGTPFEGRQLLELDGNEPVGIAQDVRVQPGARYEVRLAFSPRPGTNVGDNRIAVYFEGQLVGRVEGDGTLNQDTRWQVSTFFVTARGAYARLEIRDEGSANTLGSYLDDVRLSIAR